MIATYVVYARTDAKKPRIRAMRQGTHSERRFAANPLYRRVLTCTGSARQAVEAAREVLA